MRGRRATSLRVVVALAALGMAVGPAQAGAKTKTFSSGAINQPLADAVEPFPGLTASRIAAKPRGTVQDINLAIRISHPQTSDLTLDLEHRGGLGFVRLVENWRGPTPVNDADFGAGAAGCAGAAFTVFDGAAPTFITEADNPFVGAFKPNDALAAYNGAPLRGPWSLVIEDSNQGNAGTLHCWQMTVRYRPQKRSGKRQAP
jgi:subtilisin-like proprotein convertase family protein